MTHFLPLLINQVMFNVKSFILTKSSTTLIWHWCLWMGRVCIDYYLFELLFNAQKVEDLSGRVAANMETFFALLKLSLSQQFYWIKGIKCINQNRYEYQQKIKRVVLSSSMSDWHLLCKYRSCCNWCNPPLLSFLIIWFMLVEGLENVESNKEDSPSLSHPFQFNKVFKFYK